MDWPGMIRESEGTKIESARFGWSLVASTLCTTLPLVSFGLEVQESNRQVHNVIVVKPKYTFILILLIAEAKRNIPQRSCS